MIKLTPTARVVLGLLQLGARTGYDIKQFSDQSTRFFWGASYGQIYPELKRLAAAGLVKASAQPRGGIARTEYTVTSRGRQALRDWLVESPPSLLFEYRDEALFKLFLGDLLTKEEVASNLRQAREEFGEVATRFRKIGQQASGGGYPLVALRYGIELMEWISAWYEGAERRLEAGELPDQPGS
jgi:PadR family transcriptional regulator, regulatory protein AphA